MDQEAKKGHIVVVDDDPNLLDLMSYALQSSGFEVTTFATGEPALQYLLGASDIALVVLDRMLPDMDGMELLRQFAEKSNANVPILIISILSSEKDVAEGFHGGAITYITKPFEIQNFVNQVQAIISRRNA